MPEKLNIGFTSIGRRVELMRAFKNAYADLQLEGNIVGVDIDPLAPALAFCDHRYIVPSLDSPKYIPTLGEICKRESIAVLFPLIDPDIPVLSKNRHALEQAGTRVVVVPSRAVEITSDKKLTGEFFQNLGLKTPQSWLPEELDLQKVSYPVFIKPRLGSASKNAFQAKDARELSFFMGYVPNPIVQETLPGPEITSDVICDLRGEPLAVVSRQRIEVRLGEVSKAVTVFDQRILEACVRVAAELPAVGPITVQCMLKNGDPYFTEVNARFGGGLPLGIMAGANSPKWLLAQIAGLSVNIPSLGTYKTNLYMTRHDDSLFLTESDCEELSRHHL